jgi:hypothetical protein
MYFVIRSNSRCHRNFNDLDKSSHYQQYLQLIYKHPTSYRLRDGIMANSYIKEIKKEKQEEKFINAFG